MKKVEVTINGVAYPCRPTMGAMLRFEKETGKNVAEVFAEGETEFSFTDICTLMWCCIVSASKHDGIEFNMSLMDFADSITPEEAISWNSKAMASQKEPGDEAGAETTGDEKKSQ